VDHVQQLGVLGLRVACEGNDIAPGDSCFIKFPELAAIWNHHLHHDVRHAGIAIVFVISTTMATADEPDRKSEVTAAQP